MTMLRNAAYLQNPTYASRLYSRRLVDVRAQLLARRQADGRIVVVHGRTVDLSRSGAGVTLTRELASGTEVVLCLQLPGIGEPLCLRAVIRRRHGFRAGLEFVEPTAEQRLLLCRFCHA
jgi:PilZ domain